MDNGAVCCCGCADLADSGDHLSAENHVYPKSPTRIQKSGDRHPIIVFAFCGFDHSVANTLYLFFHGFGGNAIPYLLVCVAGNILGGVILPILSLFRAWSDQPHEVKTSEENIEK